MPIICWQLTAHSWRRQKKKGKEEVEIEERTEAPGEEGRAAPVEEEDVGNFEDSLQTVEEQATLEHTTREPESREQDHIFRNPGYSFNGSHASPAGPG